MPSSSRRSVLGLAANLWLRGLPGLLLAFGGLLLASLIYFPLYLLKGIGAGDVKLMAALGMIVGPYPWLWLFLFSALFSATAGVLLAATKGQAAGSRGQYRPAHPGTGRIPRAAPEA
jgi:prepilin peptidase CpaA